MGLARDHSPAHEPVPQPGLAGESNVAVLIVPRIEHFTELQSSETRFLQAATQFEGVIEFLADFAFGIEPYNKVVGAPRCPSLSTPQSLFFVLTPLPLPVEDQSPLIEHRFHGWENSSESTTWSKSCGRLSQDLVHYI